jgi:hypothetical protein
MIPGNRHGIRLAGWMVEILLTPFGIGRQLGCPIAHPGMAVRPRNIRSAPARRLAEQRRVGKIREQELKQLMNRAEQSTGGAFVNVIAYKADYVAVTEELKVIEGTMRVKKCRPENWGSTSAIR